MRSAPIFTPVRVQGVTDIKPAGDKQVVFHGTNKSGSLALVRSLRLAYERAGRESEFISTYGAGLTSRAELAEVAQNASGAALFSAHYLMGFMPPRPDRIFTTILRHPLPRAVSIHQWQIKRLNRSNPSAAAEFPDLETWLQTGDKQQYFASTQFGVGYGPDRDELQTSLTTAEMLGRAKVAVSNQIAALAIAERFEESIFLFAYILGLKEVPLWLRDRRNPGRPLVSTLSNSTIELIETVFEPDFEFYEWAVREVFNKQMARIDFGDSLVDYQNMCQSQYNDRIII